MKKALIIMIVSAIPISMIGGCFLLLITLRNAPVKITFYNQSGRDISEIKFKCKNGTYLIEDLKKEESETLKFHIRGEDNCGYYIKFMDGKTIKEGLYIEAAQTISVKIKNDTVECHYEAFY